MKEVYLAYFDLLGFKEFVYNNDTATMNRRMGHLFRDIEISLALGKFHPPSNGVVLADISQSRINSLSISDTIVFWTHNCELDSLKELIEVSSYFNRQMILYNCPLRGALIKGDIDIIKGQSSNIHNSVYDAQCLYDKGLVDVHIKAESLDWAGTVLDESIIKDLSTQNALNFIDNLAIKYDVPYKTGKVTEYAFTMMDKGMDETALKNVVRLIEAAFSKDNKSVDHPSVQQKINNTKQFLIDVN